TDAGDTSGRGAVAETAPERPALSVTEPGLTASVIVPQGSDTGGAPPPPAALEDTPPTRQPSDAGRRRAELITHRPEDETHRHHSRRRRVTTAAREAVEEKLSPRVEKLRHASNVMLEEASYDPSLRFVLVAAAAVILSLLLLLLNYVLG
ncbi:MAG TPA: hypothetical protein VJ715_11255, partial [Pyrinomonadaceae bacterium]|nr:hypothetical protein [Pyrinomonadaceae bacterium]